MNLLYAILFAASVIGAGTQNTKKTPEFVECTPDAIRICATGTRIEWDDLQRPDSAMVATLDRIQKNADKEYVVVLVHPKSLKFYRALRNMLGKRPIDVGYEPIDSDLRVEGGEVIDEKGRKLTGFKVMPRAVPTNKTPVFFECQGDEITFIDKERLDSRVSKKLSKLDTKILAKDLPQFLKMLQAEEIGNAYYVVDPKFLLVGVMALERRKGAVGELSDELAQRRSVFQMTVRTMDAANEYAAFLVRDDSFVIFRKARQLAESQGITCGWELLGTDEPIKFGQGGTAIAPQ